MDELVPVLFLFSLCQKTSLFLKEQQLMSRFDVNN